MPNPVTIAASESHRVQSRYVEQEFEIRVARPIPGPMSPRPDCWDVLYVLDGDLFFGTAVETTRLMHQLWEELPPLLVVGVGYGVADPGVQAELRTRDFTPSGDDRFLEMGRRMGGGRPPLLPEDRAMGGADAFLDVLQREVQPLVTAHYPVNQDGATVFGSSFGGLFATHALLTRPEAFGRYVIASPALWWDGEYAFDREEETARQRSDLEADVFMGVGALEENPAIPSLAQFRLVTNVQRMAAQLRSRQYPNLGLSHHEFADETHTSVVPAVLTRGLRTLHRPLPPPAPPAG